MKESNWQDEVLQPPYWRNRCLRRLASGERLSRDATAVHKYFKGYYFKEWVVLYYIAIQQWTFVFISENKQTKKTPKPPPPKNPHWNYTQVPPADFSTALSLWGTSNQIPEIHERSLVSQCSRGQSEDQQGEISSRQPVTRYREYIYNCVSLVIFHRLNSSSSI